MAYYLGPGRWKDSQHEITPVLKRTPNMVYAGFSEDHKHRFWLVFPVKDTRYDLKQYQWHWFQLVGKKDVVSTELVIDITIK